MKREVGGGIGMGNTCKPIAVSFQCITKSTTIKKKLKKNVAFQWPLYLYAFVLRKQSERLNNMCTEIAPTLSPELVRWISEARFKKTIDKLNRFSLNL